MSDLVRLSITMERELHDQLQTILERDAYSNRSEFIRDMVRNCLVEREWDQNVVVLGTITIVYDHHAFDLSRKLTEHQHKHHDLVLATTHVHLNHDLCAEVIIARGPAGDIQRFCDGIRLQKGVLHTALSSSTLGQGLPRH